MGKTFSEKKSIVYIFIISSIIAVINSRSRVLQAKTNADTTDSVVEDNTVAEETPLIEDTAVAVTTPVVEDTTVAAATPLVEKTVAVTSPVVEANTVNQANTVAEISPYDQGSLDAKRKGIDIPDYMDDDLVPWIDMPEIPDNIVPTYYCDSVCVQLYSILNTLNDNYAELIKEAFVEHYNFKK